jgi:membrane protein DedA with SNARE-associated domain
LCGTTSRRASLLRLEQPTEHTSLMVNINQFLIDHGGPVLFGVVFAEQAGLPLPSAPWLLAAGALAAAGKLNPTLAIGLVAVAAVLADSLWFYLGRRGGQRMLRPFCRLSLARNSCVGRTKGLFANHGLEALMAAKFLPGLGAVMPPLAGALGMSTTRFLLFDSFGSLVYAAFYILAGFVFHNQLQQSLAILNRLGFSVFLLALVLVAGYIAFKYMRRRKLPSQGGRQQVSKKQLPMRDSIFDHAAPGSAGVSPAVFAVGYPDQPAGRRRSQGQFMTGLSADVIEDEDNGPEMRPIENCKLQIENYKLATKPETRVAIPPLPFQGERAGVRGSLSPELSVSDSFCS